MPYLYPLFNLNLDFRAVDFCYREGNLYALHTRGYILNFKAPDTLTDTVLNAGPGARFFCIGDTSTLGVVYFSKIKVFKGGNLTGVYRLPSELGDLTCRGDTVYTYDDSTVYKITPGKAPFEMFNLRGGIRDVFFRGETLFVLLGDLLLKGEGDTLLPLRFDSLVGIRRVRPYGRGYLVLLDGDVLVFHGRKTHEVLWGVRDFALVGDTLIVQMEEGFRAFVIKERGRRWRRRRR